MVGSLAFRKNTAEIWNGRAPHKYHRVVPYVVGDRVLEIGAAEGVLALLLADSGKSVVALEKREDRHREALALQERWGKLGHNVKTCKMALGMIQYELCLMSAIDCLVAVRCIYYLGDALDPVFAEAAKRIKNVVLCGNANRAAGYYAGKLESDVGPDNFYASAEGMQAVLQRHGYDITACITDGDPIVVGCHV